MVVHLLEIGGALFTVFAGWGLSSSDKFDIGGDREEKLAAYGLLVCTVIYAAIFPMAINSIYRKFLKEKNDKTVLSHQFAFTCAICLSLATCCVAVLLAKIRF